MGDSSKAAHAIHEILAGRARWISIAHGPNEAGNIAVCGWASRPRRAGAHGICRVASAWMAAAWINWEPLPAMRAIGGSDAVVLECPPTHFSTMAPLDGFGPQAVTGPENADAPNPCCTAFPACLPRSLRSYAIGHSAASGLSEGAWRAQFCTNRQKRGDCCGHEHQDRRHGRPSAPTDFGEKLGLYRLVRWTKGRVRASERPPAERAAILAEIERQYRAARAVATESPPAA